MYTLCSHFIKWVQSCYLRTESKTLWKKKKKKGRGTVPRSDPKPQRLMKRLLCALDQAVTLWIAVDIFNAASTAARRTLTQSKWWRETILILASGSFDCHLEQEVGGALQNEIIEFFLPHWRPSLGFKRKILHLFFFFKLWFFFFPAKWVQMESIIELRTSDSRNRGCLLKSKAASLGLAKKKKQLYSHEQLLYSTLKKMSH